ncbi:MAG: helix-turn-helix transcriptional regulator [Halobacteriota archaeon]
MDENADPYRDLRLAICSNHRRAILVSLNERPKSLSELRDELKTSSPALIKAFRELEGNRLVRQDSERRYGVTPIGRGAARKILDFRRTMEVLQQHATFWSNHDVTGIPDHLFDQVGSLRDTTLITGAPPDIFKAMRRFVELLQQSAVIKLISPIYIPNIESIVLDKLVSAELRIELLLTDEVLHHFIGEAEDVSLKEARDIYLKLRVLREDPKLVLVVTDRFMALALYRTDGTFDYSSTLTSEDPEAIAWSRQLFNHYVIESGDITF